MKESSKVSKEIEVIPGTANELFVDAYVQSLDTNRKQQRPFCSTGSNAAGSKCGKQSRFALP